MRLVMIYFLAYIKNNYLDLIWSFFFAIGFYIIFKLCKYKHWTKAYGRELRSDIYGVLLSLSCSFVFVMTLFGRLKGDYAFKIIPFESYYKAFNENNVELILQLIMNIVMYIPIGFLLPCCFKFLEKGRYVLFVTFVFSGSIELLQGLLEIGYFEVDDIINNALGAGIGVFIYISQVRLKKCLSKAI